jgi:hypothetical protein
MTKQQQPKTLCSSPSRSLFFLFALLSIRIPENMSNGS